MGDSSYPAPSILDGYISEADLARQLNRSVRTLQRLAARRLGLPRTKIGRLIFYNVELVRAWLLQQEQPAQAGRQRPSSRYQTLAPRLGAQRLSIRLAQRQEHAIDTRGCIVFETVNAARRLIGHRPSVGGLSTAYYREMGAVTI